ncbi:MAG: GNAT family N-acetyltransferase [Pseudomonadales bacterium]|nr:GNAT family N-acetyltransferase [Pseudomonadales bacterium]MCP5216184.1 GNAT family N-acetyltransferase [Pseudomonadales bacterium]
MTNIDLRSLRPEDLDKVVTIDAENSGRVRRSFYDKRLEIALAAPESLITCAATVEGELIGFSFVRIEDGAFGINERIAVIDVIGVAKAYRQGGVATLMMEELERRMTKQSIKNIRTMIDWSDTGLTGYFSAAGFKLVPSIVVNRECESQPSFDGGDPESPRYQDGANNDYVSLFRDTIPVRTMKESDLAGIVKVDKKLTGNDRTAFYRSKISEVLNESGIRVSLVVEQDNTVVGFAMVRLDYGEFGQMEPSAVLDTLGVNPEYHRSGVGKALLSQLMVNLSALQVNNIQTQVHWESFGLLEFLSNCGFKATQNLVLNKSLP